MSAAGVRCQLSVFGSDHSARIRAQSLQPPTSQFRDFPFLVRSGIGTEGGEGKEKSAVRRHTRRATPSHTSNAILAGCGLLLRYARAAQRSERDLLAVTLFFCWSLFLSWMTIRGPGEGFWKLQRRRGCVRSPGPQIGASDTGRCSLLVKKRVQQGVRLLATNSTLWA
ncbi:hypothetical protein HDK77DRAFT_223535 [Phyllosticta capitalensis]|uniref:Uncharacterized protein n=1 Tax=Phyllosticta capitalensis TaxID=121624 RepID=A0ABR1Z4G9_9PEZI